MAGAFKPLLPLGDGSVLSRCVRGFRQAGLERIIVVTGRRGDEVAAAARAAGAEPVHNPDYEQGMFTSILAGVRALKGEDAFSLLPVDMPLVRAVTIGRLRDAYLKDTPQILYPRFQGERGHPPVINSILIPDILAHDGAGGLRTVLARFEAGARDLDVADFGVVHDIDRPGDYELARTLADRGYPNQAECDQLWALHGVSDPLAGHCRAVAEVAVALCDRLPGRQAGPLPRAGTARRALPGEGGPVPP